ncbi:MAG TPA: hypothetical protein VF711_03675, partial [Acidimicrobiales bacterium]
MGGSSAFSGASPAVDPGQARASARARAEAASNRADGIRSEAPAAPPSTGPYVLPEQSLPEAPPPAVGVHAFKASPDQPVGNKANETSMVAQAVGTGTNPASIATVATPGAALGEPISDTATVVDSSASQLPPPTGTVEFAAFGPDDTNCEGPFFFTEPQPLSATNTPTAESGPYTPTELGTYRWMAAYSGDTVYAPTISACNDANETSVVSQFGGTNPASIATVATPGAALGEPISDTATVVDSSASQLPPPTGTVEFAAFGPDDTNCEGPF